MLVCNLGSLGCRPLSVACDSVCGRIVILLCRPHHYNSFIATKPRLPWRWQHIGPQHKSRKGDCEKRMKLTKAVRAVSFPRFCTFFRPLRSVHVAGCHFRQGFHLRGCRGRERCVFPFLLSIAACLACVRSSPALSLSSISHSEKYPSTRDANRFPRCRNRIQPGDMFAKFMPPSSSKTSRSTTCTFAQTSQLQPIFAN